MLTSHALLTQPALGLVKQVRPAQVAMAAAIETVLAQGGVYFVEAPVATGKTYAYLLPALLAKDRRVVVATAKKGLQDQILLKDVPALLRVLKAAETPLNLKSVVPLKGKSNYTCQFSAARHVGQDATRDAGYGAFSARSTYGDRADYPGTVPRWWPGATADDCVGPGCPVSDTCGYLRLKRDAKQAKLVVVNHHVLGADMFFGLGKLVGGLYDVLIVDEAHTLVNGIRAAFTAHVAVDSITKLRRALARCAIAFPEVPGLSEAWDVMFGLLPPLARPEDTTRAAPVFPLAEAQDVLTRLRALYAELARVMALYRGEEGAAEHAEALAQTLREERKEREEREERDAAEALLDGSAPPPNTTPLPPADGAPDGRQHTLASLMQASRLVETLLRGLALMQDAVPPDAALSDEVAQQQRREAIKRNTAIYQQVDSQGRLSLNCAPINVGSIAAAYLRNIKTVVICSATLAVNESFAHVTQVTGLTPTHAEILPPAFNYDAQGFVYIPRDLPVLPRQDPAYHEVMHQRVARAVQLAELAQGGVFVLTTANSELDLFAQAFKQKFPGKVFVQGHSRHPWDGDPATVLEKFRATENAILVGSKSFWEGVDVPGGALRLVIMAKLPFPQYNDPIVQARQRLATQPFRDVLVADMLVELRQGVGRLIRSQDDRGCVAILDSRVWTKEYGTAVRRALPWSLTSITSDLRICQQQLPKLAAYFARLLSR